MSLSKPLRYVCWAAQVTAAAILLQTLFFKFTAAPESVYIFTTLGIEPWGRIGTGLIELVTAGLLLYPRTAALGALVALGTIGGAILGHLTRLGIAIPAVGDHGELFALAVATFVASAVVLVLRRRELPFVGPILGRSVC